MSIQILVVDDEPDVADLFRQQFRRELRAGSFTIDFAQSAADALERVTAAEEAKLILIFSDINMPGETGLQLLPKVRALKPSVPVVMITAYGDADTRRKAEESGAADLVVKPIDFSVLRLHINQRLAERGILS
jgi:CheY-like chemotaxis protein